MQVKNGIYKKLFAYLLSGVILVSGFWFGGIHAKAEEPSEAEHDGNVVIADDEESFGEIIDSGVDGGVTWSLDDEGFLNINVTGDLESRVPSFLDKKWPWQDNDWDNRRELIKTVKVSGKGLTQAQYMLSWLSNQTILDLSNFDTSTVTNMQGLFYCCEAENIDISRFDTSKVTNMNSMFYGCENVKGIDANGFDTSKVTSMSWMFAYCYNLESVDVSGFDTSNVTDMNDMFNECWSLTSLDISCFDTSNVVEMTGTSLMLSDCKSLATIKTPKKLLASDYKINLPATYINKSGKQRTQILDTNDIYTRWDVPVTGVKLNKTSLKLNVGDTTALKATIFPSDASLKTLKWSSSNKKVATVDSNGKVKALAKGTSTITVTTVDGSKKATCKVTVTEKKIDPDKPTVKTITMYRLYNPNSGEHFYSSSQIEIDTIVAAGWKNEGFAWKAPKTSKTPVYRLYNPNAGDHHYTTSAAEKENLEKAGWKYEGIGWYSDDNKGVPLYRLYNPNAQAGSHHYTTSVAEKENLEKAGWKYEGIAWYGMK